MQLRTVLLSGLAALTPIGCGKETIVIATIEDGSVDAAPTACVRSDGGTDCPNGFFCSTPTCTSTAGTCEAIPGVNSCTDDYAPECDCNGVSYFNGCLRRAAGQRVASSASCDSTFPMMPFQCRPPRAEGAPPGGEPSRACPLETSSCSFVFSISSEFADAGIDFRDLICRSPVASVVGTCWVLPATCPSSSAAHLRTCSGQCIDACVAIREGGLVFPCEVADASPE